MRWKIPWIFIILLPLKALINNINGRSLGCKIPYALAKTNSTNWADNFASTVTQKNQKWSLGERKLLEWTFNILLSERYSFLAQRNLSWKTIASSSDPVPIISVYPLTWTFKIGGDKTRKSLKIVAILLPRSMNFKFKNFTPHQVQ